MIHFSKLLVKHLVYLNVLPVLFSNRMGFLALPLLHLLLALDAKYFFFKSLFLHCELALFLDRLGSSGLPMLYISQLFFLFLNHGNFCSLFGRLGLKVCGTYQLHLLLFLAPEALNEL